MPRTKAQYAEMRDASNQKIRSAAMRLFAENGFAATSIDDIAEAAEMSKGMTYRHYKSKDALFSSLLEAAVKGNQEFAQRMESDGNPREILEGIAAEIYGDMTNGEDFTNLMMLMTQGLMLKSLPDCNALIDLDIQAIEAGAMLIRRGQELGVFGAGNPKEMSVCFFSCIQGLVMLKSALGKHFQMPSVDVMTAFLYRGIQK
jgi:AcrR family transcriptional regulator